MLSERFPKIKKNFSDFLYEEEGNIPRSTMLTIGSMVLLLSVFYADDVFAAHSSHSSHSSHKSHSSHTSHSSHSSGTHSSHASHSSNSHVSHYSTNPITNENVQMSPDINNISSDIIASSDVNISPDISADTNIATGTNQASHSSGSSGSDLGCNVSNLGALGILPAITILNKKSNS